MKRYFVWYSLQISVKLYVIELFKLLNKTFKFPLSNKNIQFAIV